MNNDVQFDTDNYLQSYRTEDKSNYFANKLISLKLAKDGRQANLILLILSLIIIAVSLFYISYGGTKYQQEDPNMVVPAEI